MSRGNHVGLVICNTETNFAVRFCYANVAQLVEQLIRNEQVTGSSPVIGSLNAAPSMPVHRGRFSLYHC